MSEAATGRRFWFVPVVVSALAAPLTRLVVDFLFFGPVSFHLSIGKWISYRMAGTVLDAWAPWVRMLFNIYGPDVFLVFVATVLLGRACPRFWLRCAAAFGFSLFVSNNLLASDPIAKMFMGTGAATDGAIGAWLIAAVLIYGGVLGGFALGGWWGRAIAPKPGLCRKCKYDLTGLMERRCPECGTEF